MKSTGLIQKKFINYGPSYGKPGLEEAAIVSVCHHGDKWPSLTTYPNISIMATTEPILSAINGAETAEILNDICNF